MICAYCNEEIIDNDYIYKYFPDESLHKPVHAYHLKITNRKRRLKDERKD